MIPAGYQYEESRIQDLYMILKNGGFDVYFPGVKNGECTAPYVVVKDDGTTKHMEFSTDAVTYAVMCYVPRNCYSKLEPFAIAVKQCIKEYAPLFRKQNFETPSYFDNNVKAYMKSISYVNYQKI